MLPSWYPTKENPFSGSFFREQALAVKDYYKFNVLHVNYKKCFLIEYFFSRKELLKIFEEGNIEEYNVTIYRPIIFYIRKYFSLFVKKIKPNKKNDSSLQVFEKSEKKQFFKILKLNSSLKFDYVYGLTAQDMACSSYIISQISKKPLVLAEHAPFPWPGKTIDSFTKEAIENADLFFAISNDKIRQILLQNIKPKRIEYLCNLVDETMFKMEPVNNKIKTFIIVASNSFYKQYDMFIKIMNHLTKITKIPFKVIVAGYGSNKGYSQNVEALEEKLKSSDFNDRLEMIRSVPRNELSDVYNRADCFVMTSIQEGQPVSALEAACCGLPVFSTRCGGVEDYVDEKIGRIYNITDYESFAQGLKQFLEEKIVFNKTYIRNTIINKFGKAAFIKNFVNYFESIRK